MASNPPELVQCERRLCPRRAIKPSRYCCTQCLPPYVAGKAHTPECQARYEALDQPVVV